MTGLKILAIRSIKNAIIYFKLKLKCNKNNANFNIFNLLGLGVKYLELHKFIENILNGVFLKILFKNFQLTLPPIFRRILNKIG